MLPKWIRALANFLFGNRFAGPAPKDDHFGKIEEWINWALVFGLIGILGCAVSEGLRENKINALLRVLGFGILLAGGGAIGGFLLGFLFAIPKTPDRPTETAAPNPNSNPPTPSTPNPPASAPGQPAQLQGASHSAVNTNLEQISDWLTKIIVGVSLVEFDSILHRAKQFANYMSVALDPWPAGGPYSLAIIGFYAPVGFFFGWVITRTYLAQWFDKTDRERAFTKSSLPGEPFVSRDTLSAGDQKKVDDVLKAGITGASSTRELADYGSAQLIAGHPDAAIQALDSALIREPQNPEFQLLKATALIRRGDTSSALGLLQTAREENASPATAAKIDENMVYAYLYKPAPEGFEKAIELGKKLESSPSLPQTSWLYVLLAAAFAQKYKFLKEQKRDEEAKAARDEALAYAKKALSADAKWKPLLQQLWDPVKFKGNPTENDLEVFNDDEDFKKLLGE